MKKIFLFYLLLILSTLSFGQTYRIIDDGCQLTIKKNGINIKSVDKDLIVLRIYLAGEYPNTTTVNDLSIEHNGQYATLIPYNDVLVLAAAPVSIEDFRQKVVDVINNNPCGAGGGGSPPDSSVYATRYFVSSYTSITSSDADIDEALGWPTEGKRYKIITWSNASNIVAVYSQVERTSDGTLHLVCTNCKAEIDCGSGNVYECRVDFKIDGARIKRVNLQNGFNEEVMEDSLTLDFSAVISWGNFLWKNLSLIDPEINLNDVDSYITNIIGANRLQVVFNGSSNCFIDGLNAGVYQIINFDGDNGQHFTNCTVGSAQSVQVRQSYTGVDFSKHYLKYVADFSQSSTSDPVNNGVAPQSDIQDVLEMTRSATGQYKYSNIVDFDSDLLQAVGSNIFVTKLNGNPPSEWNYKASSSDLYTLNPLTAFTQADDLMNYTIEFHIQIK